MHDQFSTTRGLEKKTFPAAAKYWFVLVVILKRTACFSQIDLVKWPEPKAHLSVTVNKDTVTVGECLVATVAFNVDHDNRTPLRFEDLSLFVSGIETMDFNRGGWWRGRSQMHEVVVKSITIGGKEFKNYEIFQSHYCPSAVKPMFFPALEMPIAEILTTKSDTVKSIIYFESKPITIPVIPMPVGARTDSTFGVPLCGEYVLSDSLLAKSPVANNVLAYRIIVDTNGAPVQDLVFPGRDMDVQLMRRLQTDTIVDKHLKSRITFDYNIIFRHEGKYDFSDVAVFHFWNPVTKTSQVIHSKLIVDVAPGAGKSRVYFPKIIPLQSNFIAVDVSKSMIIDDVKPSRLECARLGVYEFLRKKTQCGIGLIRFAGTSEQIAVNRDNPCDPSVLTNGLKSDDLRDGTALGETIVLALKSFGVSDTPKKLLIISDGDNTAGTISVPSAVDLAVRAHVTIYTIGVGTQEPHPFGKDKNGKPKYIMNTFSDETLKAIAKVTGGKYAAAHSEKEVEDLLKKIFQ